MALLLRPSWSATWIVAGSGISSRPRFVGLPIDAARHVCIGSVAEDAAARLGFAHIPRDHLEVFGVREAGTGPYGSPTAEQCEAAVADEPIPNHLNISDPMRRGEVLPDGSFFVLRVHIPPVAGHGSPLQLQTAHEPRPPAHTSTRLWLQAVLKADLDPRDSSIKLPDGAVWPHAGKSVLFVRPCFAALWEHILHCCKPFPATAAESASVESSVCAASVAATCINSAIIVGAAGIGKSSLGLYAAFRAVKEGRTVIYNSRSGGRFLLKGTQAFQLPSADMTNVRELDDAGTLYISDGVLPVAPANASFRLIITSPSTERLMRSEHLAEVGTTLCELPPLEDTEMSALHAACFSEQAPAGVAERMRKWGNNPRHVFSKGEDKAWQEMLQRAVASRKIFAQLRLLADPKSPDGGVAAGSSSS